MAAYLPQYHETEENNLFWGEGFTDWIGVKNAKPQFPGHNQPKRPLNGYYYDLSDWKVIQWQADLAKEYGIDGFNIYHYWFKDGKTTLQTPAELLLNHKEIEIEYFFSWDNCSWKRSWSNIPGNDWSPEADKNIKGDKECLLEMQYGSEKDWEKHFNYLLPFFKDDRYFKINNKPVFAFMTSNDKKSLTKMGKYWKKLAIQNGFDDLLLISKKDQFINKHIFDRQFLYQPADASWGKRMSIEGRLNRYFNKSLKKDCEVKYMYEYENVWRKIVKDAPRYLKQGIIVGAVSSYDDTPRRGAQAIVLNNSKPSIFYKYFKELYKLCCSYGSEFLLLTAWNEWGEGAYLEPDEENGYAYLEALKRAVESVNSDA